MRVPISEVLEASQSPDAFSCRVWDLNRSANRRLRRAVRQEARRENLNGPRVRWLIASHILRSEQRAFDHMSSNGPHGRIV